MKPMTIAEFLFHIFVTIVVAAGTALLVSGCAMIDTDRPGLLTGKVMTVAYFETQNIPNEDVQAVRESARIAYKALDLAMSGEPLDGESLILKAMNELGVDSIGLKLLALDFYTQAKNRLMIEFPEGLTPEILSNFKAGCDEVIAVYMSTLSP